MAERPSRISQLTPAEAERIESVTRRFDSGIIREGDTEVFYRIGSGTTEKLRTLLNMGDAVRVSNAETPYFKAIKITEDLLGSFSAEPDESGMKSFYYQAKSWANRM